MSEESENAAETAVVADVLGHLVEGLCETNHPAVPVPAVNETIEDAVLVALTDLLIKDDNLLVINWELFECRDFIPQRLDVFLAHYRVDIGGKVLLQSQVFFWGRFFGKEVHLVKHQQLVAHMQQNFSFDELQGPQISM